MNYKVSRMKKPLVFLLAIAMVFTYMFTGGLGRDEDWRVYAADNGNAQYSLAGAVYWVYTNSSCTTRAEDASGDPATLTTTADGTTNEIELAAGTYYVKEKVASRGYILDSTVYTVKVTSGEATWVNGNPGVKEIPQSAPFAIQKVDKETGQPVALGGASLENARFQVVYTDGGSITKTWVIKTDADGIAKLDDAHKVSGPDIYKNSQNQPVLPLGRVTVTEVDPSTGYLKNTGTITINIGWDGNTATNETTSNISSAGATEGYALGSTKPLIVKCPEQVKRGDIEFNKLAERTNSNLDVPFVIKSITTGEAHVAYAGENGFFTSHSDYNAHSTRTNANDSIINADGTPILDANGWVDIAALDSEAGIWFHKDKEGNEGAPVSDALGALPYDSYVLIELPCEINEGYVLIEREFVIKRDNYTIESGTLFDPIKEPEYDMYKVRVDEASANSEGKFGFEPGDFVTYDVFIANSNVQGTLTMDVSDEFIEGAEYFSKPVVVGVENATQNKLSEDKNTVNITIEAGLIAKVTYGALVLPTAKEYLANAEADSDSLDENGLDCNKNKPRANTPDEEDGYRNMAYTTKVKYNVPGSPEKELPDKEDDAQTPVKEPEIGTTLADDAARKVVSGNPATLVDTIEYKDLTPGKTYVFEGTLMVKDSGDPLVENGKPVTAVSDEVVPTEPNGTATVTFTVNTSNLQGKELVAFETCFATKEVDGSKPKDENGDETDKTEVAKHEDIDDPAQTVEVPGYKMYKVRNEAASAKGDKFGFEPGSTVTYDVYITNTSKSASIKMDVTDQFTQKPEYFSTPEVIEVKNAKELALSEDGNKVTIRIEAGKTAIVTYASTISEDAKEYLAAAAKDSDSKDKNGKDCNKTEQANKTDDKDGYRNIAKVENPTPEEPNPEDPDNPTPLDPLPPSEDEAQTPVKEPEIGTYLADENDAKTITASESTVLIDSVAYKGLTPGKTYAVVGELIVKETEDPVEKGEKVRAVGVFTAEEESGSIDVEFIVNTKGLEGKHLVAFEVAYDITGTDLDENSTAEEIEEEGIQVAEHKDIKDKDQTVFVKKPGRRPPVETGDATVIGIFIALLAAAAVTLLVILRKRATQR